MPLNLVLNCAHMDFLKPGISAATWCIARELPNERFPLGGMSQGIEGMVWEWRHVFSRAESRMIIMLAFCLNSSLLASMLSHPALPPPL